MAGTSTTTCSTSSASRWDSWLHTSRATCWPRSSYSGNPVRGARRSVSELPHLCPVAMALGFDKPASGLMEKKPRPLKQPLLSISQWVRIAFFGILMAIATVYLESIYEAAGMDTAATRALWPSPYSASPGDSALEARPPPLSTGTLFMIETRCFSMAWRC